MKKTLLALLTLCLSAAVHAQSARWALSPEYKFVSRLTQELYQVQTKDGKSELIVIDSIGNATHAGKATKARKKQYLGKGGPQTPDINPDSVSVVQEKSLYGYTIGERTILPPQFKAAQEFRGGYAIVETKDGAGVLRYTTDTISCKVERNEIEDNMEETVFSLIAPKERIDGSSFLMRCVDSTGMEYEAAGKPDENGTIFFTIKTFRERRNFSVNATDSNGSLTVWQHIISVIETEKPATPQPEITKTKSTKKKAKAKAKTKSKAKTGKSGKRA